MTTSSYRQEPNRLILRLQHIDLVHRVATGERIRVDLGRATVDIPMPLDWDTTGINYQPIHVLHDPTGRTWTPVQWTDKGTEAELWTPWQYPLTPPPPPHQGHP